MQARAERLQRLFLACIGLARYTMVDLRVPDEINVKHRSEVVPCFDLPLAMLPGGHRSSARAISLTGTVLGRVEVEQVAEVFDHLIADLHSHALLRNGLEQRA